MMETQPKAVFKVCPLCRACWFSPAELLEDPTVEFLGFQPGHISHETGLFLFGHRACATTIALSMASLQHLGQDPMLRVSACSCGIKSDFCLRDVRRPECPPKCICQFVWGIIYCIMNWPKRVQDRYDPGPSDNPAPETSPRLH